MINFFQSFIGAPKAIAVEPAWIPQARRGKTKIYFTAALDVANATQGGFELIGRATIEFADEDLTFQLQYNDQKSRRVTPLTRIDWRPRHEHNNKGLGPSDLKWIPINECHSHDFNDNLMFGDVIMREDNLPVARPFYDPGSFDQLLTFVGLKLNITNMVVVPSPQWPSAFKLVP